MAPTILTAATIWIGGHDFSGELNKVSVNAEAEELDKTTFASEGWSENAKGLKNVAASHEGFWWSDDEDAVDPEVFPNLGVSDQAETVSPDGQAGSPAMMFQNTSLKYTLFGDVGQLTPFTLDSAGSNTQGMKRGLVAVPKGEVDATGVAGSPVNLGAGAAGKFLYAIFHVFTAGTTISLKIESDSAEAFPSPADVTDATIGPLTARGGTWMVRVDASSITDTWFRFNATAITGTFTVAGALAIGA